MWIKYVEIKGIIWWMNNIMSRIKINCSIDKLQYDIKKTKDPIKKIILQNFLSIKKQEIMKEKYISSMNSIKYNLDILSNNQHQPSNDHDESQKLKAYQDILADNQKEQDQNELKKIRGDLEKKWNSPYDPKYAKYMKEDIMNNKLFERLNSEIDFNLSGKDKIIVEKPFDESGEMDPCDMFACYDNSDDKKNNGKNRK